MMLVGLGFLMTFQRLNGLTAVGFTFLITAGLQLCSAAILSSLARVVERESSSTYARVETSEGETKEEPVAD